MRRALALARQAEGAVEPNPMVGCVIVRDDTVLGEGFHEQFGGPHAEVHALANAGAADLRGATVYVTLEPCSHFGKTPPCADALISAGVQRVVVAMEDPFPKVSGQGIQRLRDAGIAVEVGALREDAESVNAPYLMRVRRGRPWVIAKWAMTLDGKIATSSGHSQWISNTASRQRVHQLRQRVDAIIVGSQTALDDDPQLTARPEQSRVNPRRPLRVVCDRRLRLPLESKLVTSANRDPVLVVASQAADAMKATALEQAGCELLTLDAEPETFLSGMLAALGARDCTNVLVEGGGALLGSFLEHRLIDEVWAFVAPKLVGGAEAKGPLGGQGIERMDQALALQDVQWEELDGDLFVRGRVSPPT